MKQDTQIITLGREGDFGFPSVNPPVYRTSTIIFETYEEFKNAEKGTGETPTYARYGNPTKDSLALALTELQGADYTVLTTSGLAAITTSLVAFVSQGDHILMVDNAYSPTRKFCDFELKRYGVETTYYDPTIGENIKELIQPNTKVVFLETPGSMTFEMQDVEAICRAAHAGGAVTIADNTWATPLYFKPFDWGIDISIHSCTKYIGGHSDLIMGAISARETHLPKIMRAWKHLGTCSNSDDAYLAARGLRSMAVRLKQHHASGLKVAEWLQTQEIVKQVLHPALPDDPGHALWQKYMTGACGLFAIEIQAPPKEALAEMLDHMRLFKMGFSWGGFESLIVPFIPKTCRTATLNKWDPDSLILRLHIGLEDVDDLIDDLRDGFARMKALC